MITNVLEYLEQSAAKYPDKIALADENGGITYAQYIELAKRTGTYISKQLAGPDEERIMNAPVAVLIDRSIFSIVAFMGVIYSGNFYVPIDPSMPEERINLILDTLQPVMIIDATDNDDEQGAHEHQENCSCEHHHDGDHECSCGNHDEDGKHECCEHHHDGDHECTCGHQHDDPDHECCRHHDDSDENEVFDDFDDYDEDDGIDYLEIAVTEPVDEKLLADIRSKAIDLDPLYTLFTSGSTGVPKGATITHRGVIDLVEAFDKVFDFGPDSVFGNQAPFDFDVSTKDIYDALKHGARVEVIPKKLFMLPKPLLQHLCERKIDTLIWSVSALRIIADFKAMDAKESKKTANKAVLPGTDSSVAPEAPELPPLKYVMLCGEMMPVKALNYWRAHLPQVHYVNLYGPTEITCNCVFHEIAEELGDSDLIPIGRPFPNSRVLLLDDERKNIITAKEVGKIGEICVGGSCLALGYWNNPERTEGAFIKNPFVSQYPSTLYATGDMAYYNENGDLVFAARRDFQIKHMGHRIELGEVEAALNSIDFIDVACCLYNAPEKKIYCFYQSKVDDSKKIATELLTKLPKYMCPNVYVHYDRLPLNKNSKIDRVKLKEIHFK